LSVGADNFYFFVIPRQFSQDTGEWPEIQILIPDWTNFPCPGATLVLVGALVAVLAGALVAVSVGASAAVSVGASVVVSAGASDAVSAGASAVVSVGASAVVLVATVAAQQKRKQMQLT